MSIFSTPWFFFALCVVAWVAGPFRWWQQAGGVWRYSNGLSLHTGYQPRVPGRPTWLIRGSWRSGGFLAGGGGWGMLRLELASDDMVIGPSTVLFSTLLPTLTVPKKDIVEVRSGLTGRTLVRTSAVRFTFRGAPLPQVQAWWQAGLGGGG